MPRCGAGCGEFSTVSTRWCSPTAAQATSLGQLRWDSCQSSLTCRIPRLPVKDQQRGRFDVNENRNRRAECLRDMARHGRPGCGRVEGAGWMTILHPAPPVHSWSPFVISPSALQAWNYARLLLPLAHLDILCAPPLSSDSYEQWSPPPRSLSTCSSTSVISGYLG